MLADKTVRELLDAFASPAPTPGGGSASALVGAVSASLLAMVAAMPKTAHGTPEDRAALDAIHPQLIALKDQMVQLIDRDSAAYDEVVAAYRLPKATDADKAERKAAIGRAMRLATDVPLETARAAAALVGHSRIVAEHGNVNAKSDAGVAASLARSAFSGAQMNVEINLDGVGDPAYAVQARKELSDLTRATT
jgi:formiminotetrahydrofolate cyclodeaminase